MAEIGRKQKRAITLVNGTEKSASLGAGKLSRIARRRVARGATLSTMADVAEAAGVSTASVSRVLNDPEKVSRDLRIRVEAAVEKLGYVRHGPARALAARRFHTIGAIVPTLGVATFAACIETLQTRLESHGFSLLIGSSQYDTDAEARQIRNLMERGIDGLMLVGQRRHPDIYRRLREARIPYVCTYTIDRDNGLCVGYENSDGTRRMVDYLVQLGHRNISVLTSPTHNNDRIAERFRGAVERIAEIGLPEPAIVEGPYEIPDGRAGLRTIMQRKPDTTAVVCTTDLHAIGAIAEARALGFAVPSRLSITGFDDLDIVSEIEPPLTTVRVPSREIGERVADMLIASIAGRPFTELVEFTMSLAVRSSTAPPGKV